MLTQRKIGAKQNSPPRYSPLLEGSLWAKLKVFGTIQWTEHSRFIQSSRCINLQDIQGVRVTSFQH